MKAGVTVVIKRTSQSPCAGGQLLPEQQRLEAARRVAKGASEYLRKLGEWRRKSLENASRRVVGRPK